MAINRTTARWLATILLTLAAASVRAELPVPGLTGRVVDVAQLLSSSEKTRIEDRIRGLESATGGQVAVLIIPSLKGDSLEEFSMRVAEAWKIGKKGKDNGALLLISRDDRKIRWEIGYGWEGQVNDARAGDIIRGMGPSFRQGKYAEGIDYAICELQTFITGKRPAGAPAHVQTTRNRRDPGGLFFLIVLGLIFLSSIGGWGRRRFGVGPVIFLGGRGGYRSGGGGGFGGGGFSGGGGSFGGGGASGGW